MAIDLEKAKSYPFLLRIVPAIIIWGIIGVSIGDPEGELASQYWFLKPSALLFDWFFPLAIGDSDIAGWARGLFELMFDPEHPWHYDYPTWLIIFAGLIGALLAELIVYVSLYSIILLIPVWAIWWVIGDVVIGLFQYVLFPIALVVLAVFALAWAAWFFFWWRQRYQSGQGKLPAIIFTVFCLLAVPFIGHVAALTYWNQHDQKQTESALRIFNEQGQAAADELIAMAAASGTGEVAYLATLALAESERYGEIINLAKQVHEAGGPRELLFIYPIARRLDKGYFMLSKQMMALGLPGFTDRISKLEDNRDIVNQIESVIGPMYEDSTVLTLACLLPLKLSSSGLEESLQEETVADFGFRSLLYLCRALRNPG